MMRAGAALRRCVLIVTAVSVASVMTAVAAHADSNSSRIDSVPVAFDVALGNDSAIPCDTSNPLTSLVSLRHVTVRGHLTGPSSELDSDHLRGTLYSHGDGYNETFWRFTHNEDYNYVDTMAHRGHVSVSIDRVGYGDSSHPNGNLVCYSTEATVLHQIIDQLRDGHYQGTHTPRFDRVGLVGHSASGLIVEQEAADFHDIDALGVLDSGELAATSPLLVTRIAQEQARCVTGSEGTVNGYAPLETSGSQFRHDHVFNAESDIANYLADHRTKDACAGVRNAGQTLASNGVRNSLITVPVLLLGGASDRFFQCCGLQTVEYPHSRKLTTRLVPNTGHAVAFSREHQTFYNDMNDWLNNNHL